MGEGERMKGELALLWWCEPKSREMEGGKDLKRPTNVGGHPTPFMISVQERPIKPGDPGDHGIKLADCTHMSMQAGIICF